MEGTQEPMGINNAANQILAIRDEIAVMGANDYEFSALNRILKKLEKGEVTPTKAVEEAYKIQDSKASYH